jgi:glutamyl-tRNA synthetase
MKQLQTRLAPTPSGFLHVGNVFAFLVTAAEAKQHGLALRLRIDDLDRSRFRQAYLQDVFAVLRVLEIDWQFGPQNEALFLAEYRQALRLSLYESYLQRLRATGLVYACACTRSELGAKHHESTACKAQNRSLDDPSCAWRLTLEQGKALQMRNFEQQLKPVTLGTELIDPVVRRKQEGLKEPALPAYHLACIADDVLYGTTHVVRGLDLYESSVIQLFIAEILQETEFLEMHFLHHPLVQNANGLKLSKSAGDKKGSSLLVNHGTKAQLFAAVGKALGANIMGFDDFEQWWSVKKQG